MKNSCKGVYFRRWFLLKNAQIQMTCCIFVFWQTLLSKKLIKSYKLLSINSRCYNANVKLLTCLNNKLFSYELKILNYDGLWENKKFSDENQRFDWIKPIHWYWLVNINWLADIDLFKSMIWLVKSRLKDAVGGPG